MPAGLLCATCNRLFFYVSEESSSVHLREDAVCWKDRGEKVGYKRDPLSECGWTLSLEPCTTLLKFSFVFYRIFIIFALIFLILFFFIIVNTSQFFFLSFLLSWNIKFCSFFPLFFRLGLNSRLLETFSDQFYFIVSSLYVLVIQKSVFL